MECEKCKKETGADWKKLCEDCYGNKESDLILKRQLMGKAIDWFIAQEKPFEHMLSDKIIDDMFKLSNKWFEEAKKRGY